MNPNSLEDRLNDLRARGWDVAVHNDYIHEGERCAFWLFTHRSGRYVKVRGVSDNVALRQVECHAALIEQLEAKRLLEPDIVLKEFERRGVHFGSNCASYLQEAIFSMIQEARSVGFLAGLRAARSACHAEASHQRIMGRLSKAEHAELLAASIGNVQEEYLPQDSAIASQKQDASAQSEQESIERESLVSQMWSAFAAKSGSHLDAMNAAFAVVEKHFNDKLVAAHHDVRDAQNAAKQLERIAQEISDDQIGDPDVVVTDELVRNLSSVYRVAHDKEYTTPRHGNYTPNGVGAGLRAVLREFIRMLREGV